MFLKLSDIKTIQLDHTSRCNLECPQCARTTWQKTLPIQDLTLKDYEILLEPFEKDSIGLFHCGNFGDVITSPTFEETLEYSLDRVKRVTIHTHGSARKESWWRNLAQIGKDKFIVAFSIDGLKDTNHLYRVGSNYDKVIANAKAFIEAGGVARWQFIVFDHNKHQVDEARRIATDMGFSQFNAKYTGRFAEQSQTKVLTKTGTIVKDIDNSHNQKTIQEIKQTYDSFEQYIEQTPITCKYKQQQTVFIDMQMKLWPCCWMGAPGYFDTSNPQRKSFESIYSLYGKDFNNMRVYGWNALEHEFFTTYLGNSWNNKSETYKRIYTCGRTCGNKFEFSSGYGKNIRRENIGKTHE